MMTLDCQHCGARLALEGPSLPPEVRCKRCGRRTSTASAETARPATRKADSDPPTAEPRPTRMPPPSYPPPDVRVPPEEIFSRPKPRPGFYDSDGPLPDGKGKAIALIGGVLGVLVAFAAGAWWLLATSQPQTPFVGPTLITDSTQQGNAQRQPEPPTAPPQARADAPQTTPRPEPPSARPTAAPQAATLADAIDVSAALCNRDVFLASEIALREFERQFGASPPDIDLAQILRAANDEKVNAFHLLERIRALSAVEWMKRNRPTLCLQFKSSLRRPVKATIRIGLKDTFARSLFNGGVSSAPDRAVEWRDDGTAQVPFYLSLDQAKIYELKSPVTVNLEFIVEYEDRSREAPIPHEIRVHPVNYIELRYPFSLAFATMVDEDHPIVKDLVNKISGSGFCKRTGITLGGSEVDLREMFAVWRELKARGIRYSNIADTSSLDVQEVRSLQECLRGADQGHANCADGSVLLASVCQKIGASPNLVRIPGHMLLMFPFDKVRGGWLGLETTLLESEASADKEWHDFVRGLPGVPEFEKRLTAQERTQWLSFLGALQRGTDTVMMCETAIFKGLPRNPANPIYPDGTDPAKAYLTALESALANGDDQAGRIWDELQAQFLSYCDISAARGDGVKPIGHDPKSLPKDLAGPLKAP